MSVVLSFKICDETAFLTDKRYASDGNIIDFVAGSHILCCLNHHVNMIFPWKRVHSDAYIKVKHNCRRTFKVDLHKSIEFGVEAADCVHDFIKQEFHQN